MMPQKFLALSLIELLITLALMSILLTLSIFSFRHILFLNRTHTQVNQLITAIYYARSQAILHNTLVTFCPSHNQKTCSGAWRDGQILIANGQILRVYSAIPKEDRLWWDGSYGKNDVLEFSPDGFTKGQRGSFYYCDSRGEGKRIVVQFTGRVRVEDEKIKCQEARMSLQ